MAVVVVLLLLSLFPNTTVKRGWAVQIELWVGIHVVLFSWVEADTSVTIRNMYRNHNFLLLFVLCLKLKIKALFQRNVCSMRVGNRIVLLWCYIVSGVFNGESLWGKGEFLSWGWVVGHVCTKRGTGLLINLNIHGRRLQQACGFVQTFVTNFG